MWQRHSVSGLVTNLTCKADGNRLYTLEEKWKKTKKKNRTMNEKECKKVKKKRSYTLRK
jgi:hypothetical protein